MWPHHSLTSIFMFDLIISHDSKSFHFSCLFKLLSLLFLLIILNFLLYHLLLSFDVCNPFITSLLLLDSYLLHHPTSHIWLLSSLGIWLNQSIVFCDSSPRVLRHDHTQRGGIAFSAMHLSTWGTSLVERSKWAWLVVIRVGSRLPSDISIGQTAFT